MLINNEGKAIIGASCLLTHEDQDSFSWIFKQINIAISGFEPRVFITDGSILLIFIFIFFKIKKKKKKEN